MDNSPDPLYNHLYNIEAGRDFLGDLAAQIIAECADNPLAISDYLILLPNRRACRALADCFYHQRAQKISLLPTMQPLGEIDAHLMRFFNQQHHSHHHQYYQEWAKIPPAIGEMERQFIFVKLIMAKDKALPLERAMLVASSLGAWMDQVDTQEIGLDALDGLVPTELADHWQLTLQFLEVLKLEWPNILKERGCISAPKRRAQLVDLQIRHWQHSPPTQPIIAAGSTGTVPASARLLNAIRQMPMGKVVLPGLDQGLDDDLTAMILEDSAHPQHGLALLLQQFNIKPNQVKTWPYAAKSDQNANRDAALKRQHFMFEAMLPAAADTDIYHRSFDKHALNGIHLIEANMIQQEAECCAVLLRQIAEDPNKKAALICFDRNLARRVVAELTRWDIEIDDSAGLQAIHTPLGSFLSLITQLFASHFNPVHLLALLKHPFACAGYERKDFLDLLRAFEQKILRGAAGGGSGMAGLYDALAQIMQDPDHARLKQMLDSLDDCFLPLQKFYDDQDQSARMDQLLYAHIRVAERLASAPAKTGADKLWQKEAGFAIAAQIERILSHESLLPALIPADYEASFRALFQGLTVRPAYGRHPNLVILSPLEARLQHFDLVILGGLNEGRWPQSVGGDPFMSRLMRDDFGLPALERKIGLSAHDFYMMAHHQQCHITYVKMLDNAPAQPARWLERMEVTAKKADLSFDEAPLLKQWAGQINQPPPYRPLPRPAPIPPLTARPNRLSVTNIKKLRDNPYEIYARYILKLFALDALENEPDAAEMGNMIHRILEDYYLERKDQPQLGFNRSRLIEIGETIFASLKQSHPEIYHHRWQKFLMMTNHLQQHIQKTDDHPLHSHLPEITGNYEISLSNGTIFTMVAKADRIDLRQDGRLDIIDYKTGNAPSKSKLESGEEPQMMLEALIAMNAGFAAPPINGKRINKVGRLRIFGVGGQETPKFIDLDLAEDQADHKIKHIEDELVALLEYFARGTTPYPANLPLQDRYEEPYSHLARIEEWSVRADGGDHAE
ncbi:MAG: double-strand break repair protein AddB [Alphaproteobacteria bacterium]